MALYMYSAATLEGKVVKGSIEAADINQLREHLHDRKLFLIDGEETLSTVRNKRLKLPEVSDFCRQMGSMLGAGITLVKAMSILLLRDLKPAQIELYNDLFQNIKRGTPLSDSMEALGGAFPELLINMIRAGEESGGMDKTCMRMAEHYEKEHKLNSNVKSALAYPTFLLVILVLAVIGIFTFIMPQFMALFEDMELPLPTKIVVAISDFITQKWYILITVVGILAALIITAMKTPKIRIGFDKFLIHLGKIGKLLKIIYTSRFCRTLNSLYSSGLSIIQCLQISKNIIGNSYISHQFEDMIKKVRQGVALSTAISEVDGFDKKLYSTILIGEESGRLDELLEATADSYDYESEIALKKLTSMIEPVLIVVMALVVGFVFISVMLPIYNLYANIQA